MTPTNSPESAVLTDEQQEREQFEAWWKTSGMTKFKDTAEAAWQARAALSTSHEASGEAVPGWVRIPLPGAVVSADHPITCLNPTPSFEVVETKIEGDRVSVRGENTCWFGLGMISTPPSPQPATTPSAEPASAREVKNQLCIQGYLNSTFDAILKSNSPDGTFNLLTSLAHTAVDMAFAAATKQPAGEVQEAVALVTKTAPKEIWLQVFDSAVEAEGQEFPANLEDITWSPDEVFDVDVKYVRADLVSPPPAAPAVPEGWIIERQPDDELLVRSPVSGPGGCVIKANPQPLTTRLLKALAEALLASAPQQPKEPGA